eukprot:2034020-Rhodomonas_salina.3
MPASQGMRERTQTPGSTLALLLANPPLDSGLHLARTGGSCAAESTASPPRLVAAYPAVSTGLRAASTGLRVAGA